MEGQDTNPVDAKYARRRGQRPTRLTRPATDSAIRTSAYVRGSDGPQKKAKPRRNASAIAGEALRGMLFVVCDHAVCTYLVEKAETLARIANDESMTSMPALRTQ